ncbi:hypothetical protein BC833DRAFT_570049 [Globomyces pollinis-pini]|nr:hypothetical protein BC833DRAFT_570049 [Globomyces pollinis-pini]
MPGVDLNDQMKFGRKVPIVGYDKTSHNQFRLLIIAALVDKYRSNQNGQVNNPNIDLQELTSDLHFPIQSDDNQKRLSCTFCEQNGFARVITVWHCSGCCVPLCLTKKRNCFASYHLKHAEDLELKKKRMKRI